MTKVTEIDEQWLHAWLSSFGSKSDVGVLYYRICMQLDFKQVLNTNFNMKSWKNIMKLNFVYIQCVKSKLHINI